MPHFSHKPPFRNLGGGFCCHVFQLAKVEEHAFVFRSKSTKKTENKRISGNYHFQDLKFSAEYDIINNDK